MCSPAIEGCASASASARSTARSSASPSSTNSIAGSGTAGVSCATCAITHDEGKETSPESASISPRSSAKSDDLPLPFAPMGPTLCPGYTVSAASSSKRLLPRESVRLLSRSMGQQRKSGSGKRSSAAQGFAPRIAFVPLFEREVIVDDQRRVVGKAPALVDRHGVSLDGDARRG